MFVYMAIVCRRLTDMSVLELGGLEGLNKLNIVRLKVTDNAILFLAEHTPSLERLHLSYCDRLTLDAIHIMINKLTRLQHLSATGIPALKSEYIQRYSDLPPEASLLSVLF
jgi:F-box and leucine-rich repeat protein GRR1